MSKLTKEQKEDLKIALAHWDDLCKIADEYYEKPYTTQTQIIINNLKRAKVYLETTFGCWVWHPLMKCYEEDN